MTGKQVDTNKINLETEPSGLAAPDAIAAWEEIAAGRYMPRRIRGSCRGRALG
jgi:hypothetical protein